MSVKTERNRELCSVATQHTVYLGLRGDVGLVEHVVAEKPIGYWSANLSASKLLISLVGRG